MHVLEKITQFKYSRISLKWWAFGASYSLSKKQVCIFVLIFFSFKFDVWWEYLAMLKSLALEINMNKYT